MTRRPPRFSDFPPAPLPHPSIPRSRLTGTLGLWRARHRAPARF